MGKITKTIKKIKIIKFIIDKKRDFLNKFAFYRNFRRFIKTMKWKVHFKFDRVYKEIVEELSLKYEDLKIFRPDSSFATFNMSLTALDKKSGEKVFIQISTRQFMDNKPEMSLKKCVYYHKVKKEPYIKFYNYMKDENPEIAKNFPRFIDFKISEEYIFFITKYVKFDIFYDNYKKYQFDNKVKDDFIKQLESFANIFNELKIMWTDGGPFNIMIVPKKQGALLIPVDFSDGIGHEEEIIKSNKHSLEKIINYVKSGKYEW